MNSCPATKSQGPQVHGSLSYKDLGKAPITVFAAKQGAQPGREREGWGSDAHTLPLAPDPPSPPPIQKMDQDLLVAPSLLLLQ